MKQARRCRTCDVNWPMDYALCGVCLGELSVANGFSPLPVDEAKRRANHAWFERRLKEETPEDRAARRARAREVEALLAELDKQLQD